MHFVNIKHSNWIAKIELCHHFYFSLVCFLLSKKKDERCVQEISIEDKKIKKKKLQTKKKMKSYKHQTIKISFQMNKY